MRLILDTHTLFWFAAGSSRLSATARAAIEAPDAVLFVSAVTAYEYSDLLARGRAPTSVTLAALLARLDCRLLDYSGELSLTAAALPDVHGDPIDRMLIAHAIAIDAILVTIDKDIRRYPLKTLW